MNTINAVTPQDNAIGTKVRDAGHSTFAASAAPANYPTLTEMGIKRFEQISHYTLQQEGNSKDVLRVYYRRARGSLLPQSRKYTFGRATKTIRVGGYEDSRNGNTREIQEISPVVLKAMAELDTLVKQHKEARNHKMVLIESLDELTQSMNSRIAELKSQINRLP